MADRVAGVVRDRAERERILVDIRGLAEEGANEVAGTDVVNQVGEEAAAERVITEVLDQRSPVGVRARRLDCRRRRVRISQLQYCRDVRVPRLVDQGLIRQQGVSV